MVKLKNDSKKFIEETKAPPELFGLIKEGIDNKIRIRRKPYKRILAVCAVLAVLVSIFTIDTVAQFTRELIGYESVTVPSVADAINREGILQEIGYSYTYYNGKTVEIEYIAVDAESILVYGMIKGKGEYELPDFSIYSSNNNPVYSGLSGTGDSISGKFEMRINVDNIKVFQNCKLRVALGGEFHDFPIKLKIDKSNLKTRIFKLNKTIEDTGTKITIGNFESNITSQSISYKIALPKELQKNAGYFEASVPLRLEADGKQVETMTSSLSSGFSLFNMVMKGRFDFQPIPPETKDLKLIVERIPVLEKNDPVRISVIKDAVEIKNDIRISIEDIKKRGNETIVTILGNCMYYKDSVTGLFKGKSVANERIDWELTKDGQGGNVYKHVYRFSGDVDEITVGKYLYTKTINKVYDLI